MTSAGVSKEQIDRQDDESADLRKSVAAKSEQMSQLKKKLAALLSEPEVSQSCF